MSVAGQRWRGGLVFAPGVMAFTGEIGDATPHSHAAVQVLLVTAGQVTLTDAAGDTRLADLAIIPAGVRHEVRVTTPTARGLLALLDPAGSTGRAALARLDGLPAHEVSSWISAATPRTDPLPSMTDPVSALRRRNVHPAVAAAMREADGAAGGPPPLGVVAAAVSMSPSRLSHLFTAEVGLPYAAWRRWTRLQRAVDQVRAGSSLTEAAHAAGFADSAHLTRTCRDLFGLTPTEALAATGWRPTTSARVS
ncbi:putative AraC family transcriptional regulator [Nocardia asteroides NBRC 15531]|uniref:AraC family transcriptional regulator n=1 Tax=Nocardia asteroides NBRC 15531 TaxID=1110697 RepID=U5EPP2_NOCAS|nr:putative AraC family transcriptional regulator [Nocardia asteroides NBRC 15531]SFM75878.1 AraC-type DNA-binding protein [Nocardia asteroides]VEG33894.1 Arabinose operon regulatory protein [Nocardia asteroides]